MSEHHPHPCRWSAVHASRMTREHHRDCSTSGCAGCVPCAERHCALCTRAHVTVEGRGDDQVCATCLGVTRGGLASITDRCARLLGEAIHRGLNSEAAMLAGPAADVETWGYRRMSALAGRIDRAWLEDCRDERHPAWVLGTWELLAREHLSQPSETRPTLNEARAYLDGHLTRLAHDATFAFDELAGDVAACLRHLDVVLAENEHRDTGSPCPVCGHRFLVKDYGQHDGDDMWHCERCDNWWTEEDYRAKVCGVYVGVADRLTASQIRTQYRVSESTVRKWTERGKVHRRGKDQAGRMLYDVADVLAARDARDTPQQRRDA